MMVSWRSGAAYRVDGRYGTIAEGLSQLEFGSGSVG
jgi:hypothetical protein